jgi:hypothetical protein
MFRVIVLGGMGLVACGTRTGLSISDGDSSTETMADALPGDEPVSLNLDGFPPEGPERIDCGPTTYVDAFPSETLPPADAGYDSFPSEGPVQDAGRAADVEVDGSSDETGAKVDARAFPMELPPPPPQPPRSPCFPIEAP